MGCTGVHSSHFPIETVFEQRSIVGTFPRSVVIDWDKEKMQRKFDPSALVSWVRSFPSREDIQVYLGNVHFTGERPLMRQLQALGVTVTCRQYRG